MKDRKALAEIVIEPEKGWRLPTFGSGKPNGQFRKFGFCNWNVAL